MRLYKDGKNALLLKYKTENMQKTHSFKVKLMYKAKTKDDTWRTVTDASTDVNPESIREMQKEDITRQYDGIQAALVRKNISSSHCVILF